MKYFIERAGFPVEPHQVRLKENWWKPSKLISLHRTYAEAEAKISQLSGVSKWHPKRASQ